MSSWASASVAVRSIVHGHNVMNREIAGILMAGM
jgi:hypothetical protein